MFSFLSLSLSVQPIRTPQFAVWKKYSGLGRRPLCDASGGRYILTRDTNESPEKKSLFTGNKLVLIQSVLNNGLD